MADTSSDALRTSTCAVCSAYYPLHHMKDVSSSEIPSDVLKVPELEDGAKASWPGTSIPLPYNQGLLSRVQIDPRGVELNSMGDAVLSMCKDCLRDVKKGVVPRLSLANGLFLGNIPDELRELTIIEESMIALCQSKCYIVQLKEENKEIESAGTQYGMKGHVIVYPQRPSHAASCFPPSIEEITSPICVLFVGSQKPSDAWLRDHTKPLAVNGGRVHRALMWLKNNNPLYYNIELNEGVLHQLEEDPILPFSIQHVLPTDSRDG